MRDRPQADLDHAARGPELHRRRQPRRVAEVGVPHRASIRTKGSCCTRSRYDDDGRRRSILHRASISEMVVPYGDPGPLHGWKNAFDAGEWGLGRMTQPLTLGCDCLGEIHYFDATLANEQGKPWVIANAICMHEEDYGILWKHVDLLGRHERGAAQPSPRRQLHRDRRQLRVRLLLVLLPRRQHPARGEAHRHRVADGDRAGHAARVRERDRRGRRRAAPPAHVQRPPRLRRRRRGERGLRGRGRAHAARPRQPVAERVPAAGDAARDRDRRAARGRRRARRARGASSNPNARNGLGQPTAYKLVPTMSTPTLLAHPDSPIGRRAGFAQHNLWVTPYAPDERRAAGEYPNQHAGGDGLPALDRAGPPDRRHRRRRLVHVRRHALRAARGLAGDAGRVHGLHADAVRVLRPQPRARRPAERRALSPTATPRTGAK